MPIPSALQNTFRTATTRDIRSWSFGALTRARHASATFRDNVEGTLHDQRIFGPIHELKCACGKYAGETHANMVCDMCSVKVAHRSTRSTRFGHIEIKIDVPHPLDEESLLSCWPVIPADYIESRTGSKLQNLYDQLIHVAGTSERTTITQIVQTIVDYLTPTVILLDNWNVISARDTFARGMAFERLR